MTNIIEQRIVELEKIRSLAEKQLHTTPEWQELFAVEHRLAELRSILEPKPSEDKYSEGIGNAE